MMTLLVVSLAAVVVAAALLAAGWATRRRTLTTLVKTRYGITLLNGDTFIGILTVPDRHYFEFVDAVQLLGSERHPVDGTLYILRERINYLQKLGGDS